MRIKILRSSFEEVDGIDLGKFNPGFTYDVGTALGNYLLAQGVAAPVLDDTPALVVPLDGKIQAPADCLANTIDPPVNQD